MSNRITYYTQVKVDKLLGRVLVRITEKLQNARNLFVVGKDLLLVLFVHRTNIVLKTTVGM